MKRNIILIIMAMLPFVLGAQSFNDLWKQEAEAAAKDLPRTQMEVLAKISAKARKERTYGQLLAAELKRAGLQTVVSPDSLEQEVARLEQLAETSAADPVMAAVCRTVLGKIFVENPALGDDHEVRGKAFFVQALTQPDLLAQHKAADYVPLVSEGDDSHIFGNDLLHVIGMEAGNYETLYAYYAKVANRPAMCITALEVLRCNRQSAGDSYREQLDSLLAEYADLPEAGEIAIERYKYATGDSPAEKYQYAAQVLERWGNWKRMNILRNAQSELTTPSYAASLDKGRLLPYEPLVLKLSQVRNISKLTATVWRLNADGDIQLNPANAADCAKLKKLVAGSAVQQADCWFSGMQAYEQAADSISIGGLPVGVYLLEVSADNADVKPQRQLIYVSRVFVMWEEQPEKTIRYVVVDAKTGQPLPGASLRLTANSRYNQKKEVKMLTADNKGEVLYRYDRYAPDDVYAFVGDDRACPSSSVWSSYSYYENKRTSTVVSVYTDRAIYRPGQTVHAAAIVYEHINGGLNNRVSDGKEVTFVLRDANYQTVDEQTALTDRFGTAVADFTLPASGLTGQFSVLARCGFNGTAAFHVEEYKRPTFQIEFPDYKEKYRQGDTVLVKAYAKTYSGVPVQGAKVSYTVSRRQALWCWWGSRPTDNAMLLSDTVLTDDEGAFFMRLPMVLPETGSIPATTDRYWQRGQFYNFTADVQVTDVGGESHNGQFTLPLGTKETAFSCNLPEKSLRGELKQVTFNYQNAAGQQIDGLVSFSIDGQPFRNGQRTRFAANEPIALKQLGSGRHTLEAVCGTDTLRQEFVVFSMDDKHPVINTRDWFYISSHQFADDRQPVYVQFGSSIDNQHVVYAIFSGNKVVESGTVDQSNALTTRTFIYKKEYGDGLTLTYAWVSDGVCYSHQENIQRPLPEKKLQLEWKTFRDRLTPGQQEEWTLAIRRPDGKAVDAQLMATLYDKSLDQLWMHAWSLAPNVSVSLPYAVWQGLSNPSLALSYSVPVKQLAKGALLFGSFNTEYFENLLYSYSNRVMKVGYGSSVRIRGRGNVLMAKAAAPMAASADMVVEEKAMAQNAAVELTESADVLENGSNDADRGQNEGVQLRENLNETAFFYPQLTTDAAGVVSLKFTLPESITTWRMLGIAHDSEMNYGSITAEAVAKKTVMVQPNMPRFVRQNDRAVIPARLFNTSEETVLGTAQLELVDPETGKTLCLLRKDYEITPNGTASVAFELPQLGGEASLLIARVTAAGNGYSDGEQHYLPVLPNQEMVLNTVPFTQHEAGVKTIELNRLFPSGSSQQQFTVEYTNNPAWLMIQALPYVGNPNEKNALSLVAAYYANALAKQLLQSAPQIKQTIEQWRKEQGGETSLMSNLQKDQSLKELLLDETPWVLDAKHEADQKQCLVRFFDENAISHTLTAALDHLKALQNSDGSWSWWKGMRGSLYMTVAVSKTLVRLNDMLGVQPETAQMLDKAFRFMASGIAEEVAELKKAEKKGVKNLRPSETAVNYLYTCGVDGRQLPAKAKADNDYLVALLAKRTTEFTIYGKATAAVILQRNNYGKKAAEYVQSIKEYTVYTEEMGRYFDTPKAYYSWFDYRIPTEVAAIEALKTVTPDDCATVEDMQRWLLQEKRTQAWNTPVNSVNAVYAFFGADARSAAVGKKVFNMSTLEAAEQTAVSVDGNRMELPKATAGIGYMKVGLPYDSQKTVAFNKTSAGASWGAVYAQFLQPVTDVADAVSGLTVVRELLKDGKPLADGARLQVGDRVTVRITVKADRDYDFVQLVDKRAACLEPVGQLSGYHWGYYCAPKDYTTAYYFDVFAKGKHTVETDYYVDRTGTYQTGTCTVQCAYAPEYSGRTKALMLTVE